MPLLGKRYAPLQTNRSALLNLRGLNKCGDKQRKGRIIDRKEISDL